MARKTDDRRQRARERAKKSAEENKFSGGSTYLQIPEGMQFLKLAVGKGRSSVTMELDFLPFEVTSNRTVPDTVKRDYELEKGDLEWHRTIFVHRNIGPDKKYVLCPRTIKKPCPICEERQALMDADYESNKKTIGALKPQTKDLMYVLDLNNEKEGIKIFEHSYANFREELEKELREQNDDQLYDFFQLEGGSTIKVRFAEETYEKNKFFKADRIDFKERDDYDEDRLDECPDFDDMLIIHPYEKLQKMFWGGDDVDDDTPDKEEKEEKTSRRSSRDSGDDEKEEKKTTRRSKKEEPEDDPEPEKEEKRSSRKSKEKDPEPEPEKEEKTSRRSRKEKEPEDDGEECPSGGKFGHDCDKLDECADCPSKTWEACADKQDELKKK